MIPRFNYSFSVREVWGAMSALFAKEPSGAPVYTRLFPAATVYEISSARAGIAYALAALQLPENARVGVQPYTCSSVMVAIQKAGFRLVFIDIDETLTLDTNDLADKLTGLDALIVTHTFGISAKVARIKELVEDLPVIEDCAHAFGSRYDGVQVGNFFDMAVFSFGNGKFPALGSGGLLVVNNRQYVDAVNERMHQLKPNSLFSELAFVGRQLIKSLLYSRVGYSLIYKFFSRRLADRGKQIDTHSGLENEIYRTVKGRLRTDVAEIQAAAIRQRRNALAIIDKHNATFNFIYNQDPDSTCFALVCLHEQRDDLFNHLIQGGIGAGKHFQHASLWASSFGYQRGDRPHFDQLVEQVITIPCHDALTQTDLSIIDEALARYAKRGSFREQLTAFS
ncbi:DegT/DnrJ/EryC1/StrS family aminotransferase [Spirosoma validum]|uniref:DegT/DnrJ/EryC1/StrS family aminotransferase n=1 Tax=Spirosoma validum TaxID=2771355 RepID=A0A927GCF4_9BACT|nr:DegT/DnrJ/EryC1/StrS family aminotransferase [Spirosoma validum]MBD2752588.1 DegT/DnrJ/EryC1/StrS family aminotransferase [Spirosoma validum]